MPKIANSLIGKEVKKPVEKKKMVSAISRTERAKIIFPVGRIHRLMRKSKMLARIGSTTPVYMAAVLQFLVMDILDLAGTAAKQNCKRRILPRHIKLAIGNDEEFKILLSDVVIAQGGAIPNILPQLLHKSSK